MTHSKPAVCVRKEVKIQRVPLTKNALANYVAMELRGEYVEHPMSGEFGEMLYDMIYRMVDSVCRRYRVLKRIRSVDDLAQNCWVKIIRYLPRFKQSRSSISNYCYRISNSVCISACRQAKRTPMHSTTSEGMEPETVEPLSSVSLDIRQAVEDCIQRFPRRKKFIIALLGNPRSSEYQCPAEVDVAGAAKESGTQYPYMRHFYLNKLQPFLVSKLETTRCK